MVGVVLDRRDGLALGGADWDGQILHFHGAVCWESGTVWEWCGEGGRGRGEGTFTEERGGGFVGSDDRESLTRLWPQLNERVQRYGHVGDLLQRGVGEVTQHTPAGGRGGGGGGKHKGNRDGGWRWGIYAE